MKIKIKEIFLYIIILISIGIHAQQKTDNIVHLFNRGIEDVKKGNIEEAIIGFHRIEKFISKEDKEFQQTISFLLMSCYYAKEQYEIAISYGESILRADRLPQDISNRVNLLLMYSYHGVGKTEKAKIIASNIEDIIKQTDLYQNIKFHYIVCLMDFYTKCIDSEKVLQLSKMAENIIIDQNDLSEVDYKSYMIDVNTLCISLMSFYNKIFDYKHVIQYGEKALNNIIPETEKNKFIIFVDLSNAYFKINKNQKAKKYIYEAIEIANNDKTIKNSRTTGIAYQTLADLFLEDFKPIESISWYVKAIAEYTKANDSELIYYCYSKLYYVYTQVGNIVEAEKLEHLILQNIKNIIKKNDEVTATIMSTYGDILFKYGKHDKAIDSYKNSIKIYEKLYSKDYKGLVREYTKIADVLRIKRDYQRARDYIYKAIDISSYQKEFNHDNILSYISLSDIAFDEGNIGESISYLEYIKPVIENKKLLHNIKNHYYHRMNILYSYVGGKKIELDTLYSNYLRENEGENSPNYAISLINNSSNLLSVGMYSEAIKECQVGLNILKKNNLSKTKEYHDGLRKQAYNMFNLDSIKAQSIIDSCIVLARDLFGENSLEYGEDLIASVSLSPFYLRKNMSSIEKFQKGIDIKRKLGSDYNLKYFSELRVLSTWYAYVFKNFEASYDIDKEQFIKIQTYIKDNFCYLRNSQRIGLWNNLKKNIDDLILKADLTYNNEFAKLAYNETLLRKNLLLNSNTSLRSIILSSGNNDAISTLEHYLSLLSNKDKSITDRNQLDNLERNLINIAQSYGAITDFINIDWTDIRNSLQPNEVAIEFVEYPANDNSMNYSALILNYNSFTPNIVPLFNSKELESYKDSETGFDYNNYFLYDLIWKSLEEYYLDDVKTVYFSADGLIHKIAIENLVDSNRIHAYEKWDLKRLSSTRELINRKVKHKTNKYILYGGLDYDSSISMKKNNCDIITNRYDKYDSFRFGFEKLPGTKIEINEIAKILNKNGIDYRLYDGAEGTEESFKELSNSDFNVIHLATHGFFWTNEDLKKKNHKIKHIGDLYNNAPNTIDNALCRSGIILSGSNNIINGINIPQEMEDGILTADEISTLNLNNVDMVVLSACQTALGEVNSEGVFGLQRGFKLAGVETLLMSLWKVSDDATQIFMTEFYKSLFTGKSKQESLDYAKKSLIDKGYTSPYEWAAWILLDDI